MLAYADPERFPVPCSLELERTLGHMQQWSKFTNFRDNSMEWGSEDLSLREM